MEHYEYEDTYDQNIAESLCSSEGYEIYQVVPIVERELLYGLESGSKYTTKLRYFLRKLKIETEII